MICSKKIKLVLTTIAATAAMVCTTGAFAADVTCTTSTNVRSGPGNAYSVITTMDAGAVTQDLGQTGGWTKVTVNGKTGYVYSRYLTDSSSLTPSYDEVPQANTMTVYINIDSLNVRSGAGTFYSVLGALPYGSPVTVVGTYGDWYQIEYGGSYGYIKSSYTSSTEPSNTYEAVFGTNVLSVAQSLLGRPYVSGASGPNAFDCSGFTSYVYSRCGKSIPRTSAEQYANSQHISKSELQPGDLVFFTSSSSRGGVGHVAIYLGNGQIIHAASSRTGVCTTSMYNSYYGPRYIGSGRY